MWYVGGGDEHRSQRPPYGTGKFIAGRPVTSAYVNCGGEGGEVVEGGESGEEGEGGEGGDGCEGEEGSHVNIFTPVHGLPKVGCLMVNM